MSAKSESTRERLLQAAESLVMANGFAGTTIDDILKRAELTKGAFFHHFKGKADLARALVEWHAKKDLQLFKDFAAEAEAQSDDPLVQTFCFLESFEKYVSDLNDPSPGCMYAAYTYESMQFEPSVLDFVAEVLREWSSMYARKLQEVLDIYEPAIPVTARQLSEMIVSIIEGGLVLQRAYGDIQMTARQSKQFRNYLELLFGARIPRAASKAAKKPANKRRLARTGV